MRRSSLALIAALILIVVPVIAGPAGAAGRGQSERDRILAFWTPARLASATPRDFVKSDHGFVPKARPPSGGSGAITGASWTKGGKVLRATGKVYFAMGSSNYVCSGSVVNEGLSNKSVILTAGHCAYDEVAKKFATNWIFIPEYDSGPTLSNCGATAHGCWTADALVVHNGYATAGGFNDQATLHDFAFAVVQLGGKTGADELDDIVGSFPLSTQTINIPSRLAAFGYPAAGKYHGNDLVYCAGNIFTDQYNDDNTWGMACAMTGGSSGGPWLSSFNETTGETGTLSSLNSYGYSGLKNMYGPKFNDNTADVLNVADNGPTDNTIVP